MARELFADEGQATYWLRRPMYAQLEQYGAREKDEAGFTLNASGAARRLMNKALETLEQAEKRKR